MNKKLLIIDYRANTVKIFDYDESLYPEIYDFLFILRMKGEFLYIQDCKWEIFDNLKIQIG